MITSACEKKVKKMLQKLPCINRPPKKMEVVSSLHMRVLSSGNFTQHDCSMDSFGGLWLRVTRVAMVRPFGLVLVRCQY